MDTDSTGRCKDIHIDSSLECTYHNYHNESNHNDLFRKSFQRIQGRKDKWLIRCNFHWNRNYRRKWFLDFRNNRRKNHRDIGTLRFYIRLPNNWKTISNPSIKLYKYPIWSHESVEQSNPMNPGLHSHFATPKSSKQIPSLWQVTVSHGLKNTQISDIKIRDVPKVIRDLLFVGLGSKYYSHSNWHNNNKHQQTT